MRRWVLRTLGVGGLTAAVAVAVLAAALAPASASGPAITEHTAGLTAGGVPNVITRGPDGAMWFTEYLADRIGRIDAAGNVTEYAGLSPGANPSGIVTGPDGHVWFTEFGAGKIGELDPATSTLVGETPIAPVNVQPEGIAVGSDGKLWFAENGDSRIGSIDPATHAINEYGFSGHFISCPSPVSIVAGPDGALWATCSASSTVVRIDPALAQPNTIAGITSYTLPTNTATPEGITVGPDGKLWVAEYGADKLARIDPSAVSPGTSNGITEFDAGGQPLLVAPGADGALWSTDHGNGRLLRFDLTTHATSAFDSTSGVDGQPNGVAADAAGNVWFTSSGGATAVGEVVLAAAAGATGATGASGTTGPGGGPAQPTASLTDQTPASQVGQPLTLSAAGSQIPAGQSATGYDFQLGSDPAGHARCPANDPVLQVIAANPGTFTASMTVATNLGGSATATVAVTIKPPSGLPVLKIPGAFASSAHGAALGTLGVISLECLPATAPPPSPARSQQVSRVRAAQQAPTSANANPAGCGIDIIVGIIDGLGCWQQVDATHSLPQAEAKMLCTHEKFCLNLSRVRDQPPPIFFTTAGGGSASARAAGGCNGTLGYDDIYYSTQPVGIDGLEVDPVNGGVIVLARAGVTCSNLRDTAYLLSSDAVVKVGGLPITLHVPDYGAAYTQAQDAANCGGKVANGVSNGDLSGAGCLGSLKLPSVADVQNLLPTIHGPIDLAVSPSKLGIELGEFQVPGNVLPIPVIPSLPISGTIRVNLTGLNAASVAVHVELPGLLSDGLGHGLTGDTTLSIDNVHGLELNDLDIRVPSLAQIGLARLRDLEFIYRQPSFFEGKGTIDLSDVIHGLVSADVVVNKGSFQRGTLKYFSQTADGFPLFGPLFLTQLTAGLSLNPTHVHGDTQISVGPSVTANGCGALGIHGTLDMDFGNPWTLDATGSASVLCNDFGPSKVFHADSDGHFSYGERFDYSIPGLGGVSGDEFGQAYLALHDPLKGLQPNDQLDVQLDGKLAGDFHVNECVDLPWPAGQQCTGDVHFTPQILGTIALGYQHAKLVGSAGICASLSVSLLGQSIGFNVGAGTGDLPSAILGLSTGNLAALASKFSILLDNCDIGKWRLLPPPAGFARVHAHGAAAAPYSFSIPSGEKVAVIGIQGSGGAPDVRLTAPNGKQIIAMTDGITIDNGALIVRQPSTGQMLIEIPGATAGRWTMDTAPGSPAVAAVETSQELAAPRITTHVSGSGAHRVLHYRISPQPGLAVTFLEGVDKGASLIGAAHGASGAIRFTPSVGSPKPRTIIAHIQRNGLAAPTEIVGRYSPGALRPGHATRIAVAHGRGGWRITWKPGTLATSQQLTVRFADGVQVLLAAGASQRALSIAKSIDTSRPIAIAIVALRGQTRGRLASATARPRHK